MLPPETEIKTMQAGPRCVLIDDDSDVLSMIALLLQRALPQWEVIAFQNSLEALVYLLDHHADLVVTDFRMPEMDGLVLTSHLRSAANDVPVLLISGNAMETQALAMGATAFLSKAELPAKLSQTLNSLGFYAEKRSSRQAHSV